MLGKGRTEQSSVFRSSSRSNATHSIGELKNWKDFCKEFCNKSWKKNNTWNIRLLVDNLFVPSSKQPSVIYCRLTYYIVNWRISIQQSRKEALYVRVYCRNIYTVCSIHGIGSSQNLTVIKTSNNTITMGNRIRQQIFIHILSICKSKVITLG